MARLPLSRRNSIRSSARRKKLMLYMAWLKMIASVSWFFQMIVVLGTRVALRQRYSIFKMERIHYVDRLVNQSDDTCIKNLRMNTRTFHRLCYTLESRGYIHDTKYMNVIEQVAVFLYILAHHEKMSVMSTNFQRSTESISRHFHMVLNGVLRLQEFKNPEPIPNDSTDETWKYFKVHPAAAKWQNTPMPFFKELSIIFGKDRATGNLAENLEDVVEELNTEAAAESLQEEIQRSAHSDESTSKKRKKGNIDSLLEAVYAASDRIANQFEVSTKLLIAAEEDMLGKKKQLNEELSKIPGLEVLQKLQVAKRIAKDEDLMVLFFAAPTEEKSVFVEAILKNQI